MKTSLRKRCASALGALVLLAGATVESGQSAVLVADRLSNSVYRYSNAGTFVNTVLTDNANLVQPSGMAISPDGTKLYIASSLNSQLVRYNYNPMTGTATGAAVVAGAAQGLSFPNGIIFSQDGNSMYVSNLGGTGVAHLDLDGNVVGAPLFGFLNGGPVDDGLGGSTPSVIAQLSGMAWAPDGRLLVGGFQNFPNAPGQARGAVGRSDAGLTVINDFIGPETSLNGAASLMVVGDDLYVSSGYALQIQRFDATTGAVDAGFSMSGLAFPQSLALAPGGGFLASILGFSNGAGFIGHYDFDGNPIGTGVFAAAGSGFTEATSLVVLVPEPMTAALAGVGLLPLAYVVRRRRAS